MALESTYDGDVMVLSEDDVLVLGTCMLGDDFGEVKNAAVKRAADQSAIANCKMGLKAMLLKNPRFELTMKTRFDSDITAPGLGEPITLPMPALVARILDVSVEWDEDGVRMLSITATHWDSMPTAKLYHWTGSTMTLIADPA